MPSLKLKPGNKPRVLQGHPWVFTNEVQKLLDPEFNGKAVECRDSQGELLGTGLYNGLSQIVWRKISDSKQEFNSEFIQTKLETAFGRRGGALTARLFWSESDEIPGLIIDRYGSVLVVQFLTLAVDQAQEIILTHLKKILNPTAIILRNDAPAREKEGMERFVKMIYGTVPETFWLRMGELDFLFDWQSGQKTGFYLDQTEQHKRVAAYAAGRRVLDVFCNHGGFALHCARVGALSVVAVDSSVEAIKIAKQNAVKNGIQLTAICENAFDYLKRQKANSWDLVILDPPPFAKSRDRLEEALAGYKEINLRAMKQLAPKGILATYSCSHHLSYERLRATLLQAAVDAGRRVRILEMCYQSLDHPVMLHIPESEYLRGYILELE